MQLTVPTVFVFSGWIYSNGPSADIYLFMDRAGESSYFSYIDYVTTGEINKWVYIEKEITVPQDVRSLSVRVDNNGGGTVWFDDIRLHLKNARMTTYTYEPLIGMSSATDENNRTIYYEYDDFGRLSLVRDHDKNIIRRICYNYAGQPEDCEVIHAVWQPTGNYRCVKEGTDNTGRQEREEKDIQPGSATYNQTRWVDHGENLTACPLPPVFSYNNCNGEDQKCINDICERGIKIFTDSYTRVAVHFASITMNGVMEAGLPISQ